VSPTQPFIQAPTLKTQRQPTGIQTIPHTPACQQKQQYWNIRRPTRQNTHIGICQQELAKRAWRQKRRKTHTHTHIYIYIYTFSTNLILILILNPILTSAKSKTLIF
jgi:hypothetical protein